MSGKKAFISTFNPALSFGCVKMEVNSLVTAWNASLYGDRLFLSKAGQRYCRSCSQNCTQQECLSRAFDMNAIRDGSTVTPFPQVMLEVKVSVCRLSAGKVCQKLLCGSVSPFSRVI